MHNPLVSIITPVYNRLEWLPLTLNSLLSQTYENWECILVNDGGEDASGIIEKYNEPRFKYFENSKNVGLAQTRNNGIDRANGDFFITLDSDDQLYAEAIEFRLELIKKHNVEVVYTRALKNIYEKKDNHYYLVNNILYWDSNFNRDLILVMNTCPCNCLLFSRKAQESGGYYRPELTTGEDWDHSVSMSRHFDFWESKILDCQCSWRNDGSQMTGTRNFALNTINIFKKWRETAIDRNYVVNAQNDIIKRMGYRPSDFDL